MALVVAFNEAKAKQIRREGDGKEIVGGELCTEFFASRDNPDFPHAHLHEWEPKRASRAHYHEKDQFQVFLRGKGKLGRHDLAGYCVHFARGFTPYGLLFSDDATGLDFFAMRAQQDPGSRRLPKDIDRLKRSPYHQPWQIVRPVTFPALSPDSAADIMLKPVPDIKDEAGLAVYTLSMKPKAEAHAPDPAHGAGQDLVVVKGSLLHDDKEHQALALVFIYPDEGPYHVHAGAGGMEALVLNFPRPGVRHNVRTKTGYKTWQCGLCAFVYNEAEGLPQEGIAPGTRWQDVPETWTCPDVGCNSTKRDFESVEL